MARLKWLTLSPSAVRELPNDIQFTIKKPFFTASVVLGYRFQAKGPSQQIIAETSLSAKVPILGHIQYSIEAISLPSETVSPYFAFESVLESDDARGNYRKVVTHENTFRVESSDPGSEPNSRIRELNNVPPAPLLVHLLALPALQQSREEKVDLYFAQFVNGAKFQVLRLDRLAKSDSKESYRGRTVSSMSLLSEDEIQNLSWEKATSFEFDYDLERNTISAARIQLPVVGRIEIK